MAPRRRQAVLVALLVAVLAASGGGVAWWRAWANRPVLAVVEPPAVPEAQRDRASLPPTVPDAELDAALARAVERFLDGKPFDKMSATVMLPDDDGAWRVGGYRATELWYPGCLAKLGCLPFIAHAIRTTPEPFHTEFDSDLKGAIVPSLNEPFGRVVDAVTRTRNFRPKNLEAADYKAWLANRRVFERNLADYGLLENQRIFTKTYPSNSGIMPEGAESFAWNTLGGNALRSDMTALLMIGLVEGRIEPESRDLFLSLLERDRYAVSSVLGHGLPPGTRFYSKMGSGRDVIADCVYTILPNGRRFVCCMFANSRNPPFRDDPHQSEQAILGPFAELLIEELGLYPEEARASCGVLDAGATVSDEWNVEGSKAFPTASREATGQGAELRFRLNVPRDGRFEVQYAHGLLDGGRSSVFFARSKQPPPVDEEGFAAVERIDLSRVGERWFFHGTCELKAGGVDFVLRDDTPGGRVGLSAVRIRLVPGSVPPPPPAWDGSAR